MTAPDREKALQLALAQIEKNHGKGSVMRLGDDTRPPIGVIPTGSIALDVALGVGGLPRGDVFQLKQPPQDISIIRRQTIFGKLFQFFCPDL